MYFVSRNQLGKQLSKEVLNLKGENPIVLYFNGDFALASSVAQRVDGSVYPIFYEEIILPGDDRVLGVINQDGTLCYNNSLSRYHRQDIEMNNMVYISESCREAYRRLNRKIIDYGDLDKQDLTGRSVIIVGSVVDNLLGLSAAFELLKTIVVSTKIALFGNITPEVSEKITKECDSYFYINVVPYLNQPNHYFDKY